MKFVGYDCFATLRIRYVDDHCEDISILADNSDNWWDDERQWNGYIMDMLAEIRYQREDLFKDWVSVMIILPDWLEDSALIHEITVFDGDNKIYHSLHQIRE